MNLVLLMGVIKVFVSKKSCKELSKQEQEE